jgi:hypothetical protein
MSGEAVSPSASPSPCGAELHHTHGIAACDLPAGHDGEHGALCGICYENGYDDPSDRLEWEHDGESWLTCDPPA